MTSLPVRARGCARHAVARPVGPAALAALALLGVTAAAGLPAAQAASQQAAGGHVIGVPAAGDVPVPAAPDGSLRAVGRRGARGGRDRGGGQQPMSPRWAG